jgi:hypothetical protein
MIYLRSHRASLSFLVLTKSVTSQQKFRGWICGRRVAGSAAPTARVVPSRQAASIIVR